MGGVVTVASVGAFRRGMVMALARFTRTALGGALGATMFIVALGATVTEPNTDRLPLAVNTARVTIDGNSNLHPYTASTTVVNVVRVQLADGVIGPDFWSNVVKPDALQAFEIAIPAAKLSSPKDGLDKNMHKALKVNEHPNITFRLARIEPGAAAGAYRASGTLRIAGVEKDVTLDITTLVKDGAMTVTGAVELLMPDFGIAPPKAMLGMLKTDPKVKVTFETVLALATT
jgi:polyisoprenoid-binding protein YceI